MGEIDNNTVHVTVQTSEYQTAYASLADMWSEWNWGYVSRFHHNNFTNVLPQLIIRVEDLWFHPRAVMEAIDSCIRSPRSVQPDPKTTDTAEATRRLRTVWFPPSKNHGFSSSYLSALQRYGTIAGRHKGLSRSDKLYANQVLSQHGLMSLFHYPLIPIHPTTTTTTATRP